MMENEPYIFEGKLHDFEQTIVEFLLVDAKMTGIDPNETLIYIYILLHRKLTQAQLAELCFASCPKLEARTKERGYRKAMLQITRKPKAGF